MERWHHIEPLVAAFLIPDYYVSEEGIRIQNPAAYFQMGEDIFATGFVIHEDTWRERANG